MATVAVRRVAFNYKDFRALVRNGQKADLIDGVIYMASPDNIYANELFGWLLAVMFGFARRRNLGKVYGSRVACRLDDYNAPEPDILFVSRRHASRLRRGGVQGSPDLALEIVSPDSVNRDYVEKLKQYETFKIPEYWIVDEMEKKVLVFRLDRKGKYREVRPRNGIFHSRVMTGFWLDPKWLWQEPLPDHVEILLKILGQGE